MGRVCLKKYLKKGGCMRLTTLLLLNCTFLWWSPDVYSQKSRTVSIIHDNAQVDMTTKVYELKNSLASDIAPFVDAAVRRNNTNSRCDRINYSAGGKQLLVVSMDPMMVPYIDDLVKVIDYGTVKDDEGSSLKNAGVYNYIYRPLHRSTDAMYDVINSDIWSGTRTAIFRDDESNVIYWKGTVNGGGIANWLKALDRPVPQVKLTMKIYTINESDLKEIGFDVSDKRTSSFKPRMHEFLFLG